MSLSIYKPNQKNTGCGFSFQLGLDSRTHALVLYIKAIKQHSWDENKRQGYFKENLNDPEKNIALKFNEFEVGGILNSLFRRVEYSTFHSYNQDKTVIKVGPWDKKAKKSIKNEDSGEWEEKWITVPAFSISFTKNGTQNYSLSLEPGEATAVGEYMRFVLHRIFKDRADKQLEDIKSKKKSIGEAPF